MTYTLLVDGVDLDDMAGVTLNPGLELFAPGTRRGDNDTIPGRQGQIGASKVYDAYAFAAPVTVRGDTPGEMVANLAALGAALVGTGGLVTLTRRLPSTGSTYIEHTASGEYVGSTAIALLNDITGQTELQFINLDGAWSPDGGTTWLVP